MRATNRWGKVQIKVLLWGLMAIWWLSVAPKVSAQTYDFDEGVEMVTKALISENREILKNKKLSVFGIIESRSEKKWEVSSFIEDGIVDALVKNGYRVIERRRIQDVIQEELKEVTDLWFDQDSIARFGKLVGADFVVTGRYVLWGQGMLKISIRAIKVADGEIVAADKVQVHTDRIINLLKLEEKEEPPKEANVNLEKPVVQPATEERKRLDREKLELEKLKTEIEGNRFREEQARLERERREFEQAKAEFERKQRESQKQSVEVASVPSKPSYSRPSSTSNVIKRDGIYVAYANGIVKDTKTGLEWKVGPDKDMNWNEAKSWVESLNLDGGGWRMPLPFDTQFNLDQLFPRGTLKSTRQKERTAERKN